MERYRVLRAIGCDPITAAFIAALNWAFNHPAGRIGFMNVDIDYRRTTEDRRDG